ncbi:MAG: FtsH protease activity modulator HflK [Myxococcales bacterium]|nr:FtsH protease activity modulator HflK [Myxococcales bacterium]
MKRQTLDLDRLQLPQLGGNGLRVVRGAILLILALVVAGSASYTVGPEEEGVVLRFGRYVRTAEPGLHFKLPLGAETVWKVPTQRQLKEEFGFRTVEAGARTEYSRGDFDGEKLMLTGDLNVAVVEWIAQYRVKDPYKYLFKVRIIQSTFRDMNEAVMRQIIGDRSVSEVLTIGRQEIEVEAQRLLQQMCDDYETGIQVEQVVLQNVNPPDEVKPSFDEVNQAQQERERQINDAKTAFNKVIPAARGQAEETVAQAGGYAIERTNRARGEAQRFTALRHAYEAAPAVTRKRLYLETMSQVYPKADRKVLVSEGAASVLPLLQLGGN